MTSVPAALAGLYAAVTTPTTQEGHVLFGVVPVDGQPLPGQESEPDIITIGYNPTRNAVEIERTPDGLVHEAESYTIACLASSWIGDTDPAPVRIRAFELYAAVAAVVAGDRSLGGAVTEARVEFTEFDQQQTTSGAAATVAFNVRVRAFL